MNLLTQKRIASKLLKAGVSRVRLDPESAEEIGEAITREDIRILIAKGAISAKPKQGISKGRARARKLQKKKGRRKGHGSRKGTKKARTPKKKRWIGKIRAIRDELRKLKDEKVINESQYRKLYRQSKGNLFNSRRHLRDYVERLKSG
ncbi:MAG: 50S ribosomal protein L19e [Candidatus Altiarchaeota archaeon]